MQQTTMYICREMSFLKIVATSFFIGGSLSSINAESIVDRLRASIFSNKENDQLSLDTSSRYTPSTDGDEDMGVQLILKKTPKKSKLYADVNSAIFISDNIRNTATDEETGSIFYNGIRVKWHDRIGSNLFANMSIDHSHYHYLDKHDLNLSHTKASAGLVYIESNSDVILSGNLEYGHTSDDFFSDRVLGVTSFRVNASRTFFNDMKRKTYVAVDFETDLNSSFNLSMKNELSFRLSHSIKLSNELLLTFLSEISRSFYTEVDRYDTTTSVGASLDYELNRNLLLSSYFRYSDNASNFTFANRNSSFGSLGLKLKIQF